MRMDWVRLASVEAAAKDDCEVGNSLPSETMVVGEEVEVAAGEAVEARVAAWLEAAG